MTQNFEKLYSKVIIKYWLYSLSSTMYLCTLFILPIHWETCLSRKSRYRKLWNIPDCSRKSGKCSENRRTRLTPQATWADLIPESNGVVLIFALAKVLGGTWSQSPSPFSWVMVSVITGCEQGERNLRARCDGTSCYQDLMDRAGGRPGLCLCIGTRPHWHTPRVSQVAQG